MNKQITKLALAGVEYEDSEKAKTSFYKDYINENKNTQNKKTQTLKEELKQRLNIKEVVKRPKFIFEKKKEEKLKAKVI